MYGEILCPRPIPKIDSVRWTDVLWERGFCVWNGELGATAEGNGCHASGKGVFLRDRIEGQNYVIPNEARTRFYPPQPGGS